MENVSSKFISTLDQDIIEAQFDLIITVGTQTFTRADISKDSGGAEIYCDMDFSGSRLPIRQFNFTLFRDPLLDYKQIFAKGAEITAVHRITYPDATTEDIPGGVFESTGELEDEKRYVRIKALSKLGNLTEMYPYAGDEFDRDFPDVTNKQLVDSILSGITRTVSNRLSSYKLHADKSVGYQKNTVVQLLAQANCCYLFDNRDGSVTIDSFTVPFPQKSFHLTKKMMLGGYPVISKSKPLKSVLVEHYFYESEMNSTGYNWTNTIIRKFVLERNAAGSVAEVKNPFILIFAGNASPQDVTQPTNTSIYLHAYSDTYDEVTDSGSFYTDPFTLEEWDYELTVSTTGSFFGHYYLVDLAGHVEQDLGVNYGPNPNFIVNSLENKQYKIRVDSSVSAQGYDYEWYDEEGSHTSFTSDQETISATITNLYFNSLQMEANYKKQAEEVANWIAPILEFGTYAEVKCIGMIHLDEGDKIYIDTADGDHIPAIVAKNKLTYTGYPISTMGFWLPGN